MSCTTIIMLTSTVLPNEWVVQQQIIQVYVVFRMLILNALVWWKNTQIKLCLREISPLHQITTQFHPQMFPPSLSIVHRYCRKPQTANFGDILWQHNILAHLFFKKVIFLHRFRYPTMFSKNISYYYSFCTKKC